MSHRRHGPKVLGLSLLAAFSLMAFSASAAQAAPEWTVGGTKIATLYTALSTDTLLQLWIPLWGYLHWTSGHVTRWIDPAGVGSGAIALTGGSVLDKNKKIISACSLDSATIEFEDKLVEHGGEIYDVFKPLKKESFTSISILGKECALPTEPQALTGSFADLVGATELVQQPFAFVNEATEALLKVGLKVGAQAATPLAGEGTMELVETNKGKKWGAK